MDPVFGEVRTTKEREASWCARRRGCSPKGTVRMCNFWISSMLPIVMAPSLASARLSGKLLLLKLVMKFTCNRTPQTRLNSCCDVVLEGPLKTRCTHLTDNNLMIWSCWRDLRGESSQLQLHTWNSHHMHLLEVRMSTHAPTQRGDFR